MTDRDGRTHVWAVARSPSIRDAGLYIMVGLSKDGLVAAANRRLYEDMAILAVASLLLLAGVWVLATHGRRPPGRTPRRDGDETRTWRSQRADCSSPIRAANWAD